MEINDVLKIVGRVKPILVSDIINIDDQLCRIVQNNSFLIIGGAGSIGKSLSIEIFKRNPKKIHIIDINENSLVELVRFLRSTEGYITGEFKTFVMDFGSSIFYQMLKNNQYDYITPAIILNQSLPIANFSENTKQCDLLKPSI